MASAVFKFEFQLKHFIFNDCEPARFYQSQWFKNRWIFLGIRLLFLAYWFSWYVVGFVIPTSIDRWWIFLTNWGVTVLLIYFLSSFALVIYGIDAEPGSKIEPAEPEGVVAVFRPEIDMDRRQGSNEPVLQWFHIFVWIFHQVAFGMALVITVAFYTLLTPSISPISINAHAINLVIMLIDLCLSDIPIRLLHVYHLSLASLVYAVFSLILHGAGYESAIYPVLDWEGSVGLSIGLCILIIFVAAPIAQLVAFGLYQLRLFAARQLFKKNNAPVVHMPAPVTPVVPITNSLETEIHGRNNAAFTP